MATRLASQQPGSSTSAAVLWLPVWRADVFPGTGESIGHANSKILIDKQFRSVFRLIFIAHSFGTENSKILLKRQFHRETARFLWRPSRKQQGTGTLRRREDCEQTKSEDRNPNPRRGQGLVGLRISFGFRRSDFGLGHSYGNAPGKAGASEFCITPFVPRACRCFRAQAMTSWAFAFLGSIRRASSSCANAASHRPAWARALPNIRRSGWKRGNTPATDWNCSAASAYWPIVWERLP